MNNRYIFRGKRESGEWIYGDLIIGQHDEYYIHPNANAFSVNEYNLAKCIQMIKVIPETVGQCTGLKDKNGKWIFENDIVKDTGSGICYFIKWFPECACYSLANKDGQMNFGCDELEMFLDDLSVIGNIHDNPKLLEVEQ